MAKYVSFVSQLFKKLLLLILILIIYLLKIITEYEHETDSEQSKIYINIVFYFPLFK